MIKTAFTIAMTLMIGLTAFAMLGCGTGDEGELRAAFDAEFFTRPDGYEGLAEAYGFRFDSTPRQMDPGLMYKALADGQVDVIDGFATDGRIPAYNLVALEDDKNFFPPYYAAPVVREETLVEHPQIKEVLERLDGRISDATMQQLNYEVDENGRKAREVARDFLDKEGLIKSGVEPPQDVSGTIRVGGKHFTEQEILGEMIAIMIEENTGLKVKRKLNLGGTMICFNALRSGDLDVYAEYTGTGLVNILEKGVISDPDEAYRMVQDAFREEYDLRWLDPFGFNNTYTLTMREDHAKELGIETISDLADYISGDEGE
ncbi:MAG: glycine betaine ABC transporter substrate-binding protein [Candidatus Sumerlaeia bacterium]